jgi:hypothetical protein
MGRGQRAKILHCSLKQTLFFTMTELAIEVKDLEFAWPSKAAFLRVPTLSLQQGQTLFVGSGFNLCVQLSV